MGTHIEEVSVGGDVTWVASFLTPDWLNAETHSLKGTSSRLPGVKMIVILRRNYRSLTDPQISFDIHIIAGRLNLTRKMRRIREAGTRVRVSLCTDAVSPSHLPPRASRGRGGGGGAAACSSLLCLFHPLRMSRLLFVCFRSRFICSVSPLPFQL